MRLYDGISLFLLLGHSIRQVAIYPARITIFHQMPISCYISQSFSTPICTEISHLTPFASPSLWRTALITLALMRAISSP
ncbi:hypothetical protein KC335_g133 [Hortaea werneckii]|nr:hypothetical protein KC335_g133 [Hortaea werneckii]